MSAAAASVDSSLWVRRFSAPGTPRIPDPADPAGSADPPLRLLCLPHAGGSASVFRPWAAAAGPDVEVLALQYPGRQDRYREPAVADLTRLADLAAPAVRAAVGDGRYALFGHSMGALLAFELTRRLERDGRAPELLTVSGRRAPSTRRDGEYAHLTDDRSLAAHLRDLSGTDPRLLADEEALQMILPAVRADLAAVGGYFAGPEVTVATPVLALIGDADPWVTPTEAAAWQRHTTAAFELGIHPGGHFYLDGRRQELLALLDDRLTTARR
ncbi:thioesterase II family protein [Kitasatospora sp. NPDC059146]|uniref:thioesterase II family protein n=1 Tax=unclassified Kitasatospora TaxID=2633591 RepID=UPI00368FC005